jgi:hypothetical protein
MNLLDPVKWGAQAAFSVTSAAVKVGINAVRTAELLLGRDGADEEEHRYGATATAPPTAPTPPAPAEPPPRRRERRPTDPAPPAPESRFDRVDAGASVVESEGAADPGATLRVDEPFEGYDKLRAPEIVARVRESDDAVKAVVRLYESTHKKRKSVLAATE